MTTVEAQPVSNVMESRKKRSIVEAARLVSGELRGHLGYSTVWHQSPRRGDAQSL